MIPSTSIHHSRNHDRLDIGSSFGAAKATTSAATTTALQSFTSDSVRSQSHGDIRSLSNSSSFDTLDDDDDDENDDEDIDDNIDNENGDDRIVGGNIELTRRSGGVDYRAIPLEDRRRISPIDTDPARMRTTAFAHPAHPPPPPPPSRQREGEDLRDSRQARRQRHRRRHLDDHVGEIAEVGEIVGNGVGLFV